MFLVFFFFFFFFEKKKKNTCKLVYPTASLFLNGFANTRFHQIDSSKGEICKNLTSEYKSSRVF